MCFYDLAIKIFGTHNVSDEILAQFWVHCCFSDIIFYRSWPCTNTTTQEPPPSRAVFLKP